MIEVAWLSLRLVSLVSREHSEKNDILYTHPPKTGLASYCLDLVHLAVVHLLAKSLARVFPSVRDTRHGTKRLAWNPRCCCGFTTLLNRSFLLPSVIGDGMGGGPGETTLPSAV
jgi:hypothetical protein